MADNGQAKGRQTKAELLEHIRFQDEIIETQAARIKELMDDKQNARLEVIRLKEQLKKYEENGNNQHRVPNCSEPYAAEDKAEQITERFTVIPGRPKRGARRKADPETRQYIHELRKYGNSLQAIAEQTGMSKTQCHAILKEQEIPGSWYSEQNGKRTYYGDYETALNSRKEIHFEALKGGK